MSRYFQQLARHTGLAPAAPGGAAQPGSPVSTPQTQADLVEENVERQAVPESPGALTPSAASTEFSSAALAKIEPVSPPARSSEEADATRSDEAENVSPSPVLAAGVSVARPSSVEPVVSPPENSLSSSALLQQVVAWIAEAEHALAAPPSTASTPGSSSQEKNAPLQRDVRVAPLAPVVPPPAGVVEILPAFDARVASPATVSAGDAPDDFHVSIGSIHLIVEVPPASPVAPSPAPRSVPPSSPPAPTRSIPPTCARRHYLRSFT
jgi:hypothetical protein